MIFFLFHIEFEKNVGGLLRGGGGGGWLIGVGRRGWGAGPTNNLKGGGNRGEGGGQRVCWPPSQIIGEACPHPLLPTPMSHPPSSYAYELDNLPCT